MVLVAALIVSGIGTYAWLTRTNDNFTAVSADVAVIDFAIEGGMVALNPNAVAGKGILFTGSTLS